MTPAAPPSVLPARSMMGLAIGLVLVVACSVGTLLTAAPAVAASAGGTSSGVSAATSSAPLRVRIDTLSPATIPTQGRLRVTGTITNRSKHTWTDLQVYLLTSSSPLPSRSALARAADTDSDAEVGRRVADPGYFAKVGDLDPGQSASYRLAVPRSHLGISGRPGVYWVGVHVLGALDGARDNVADGRARTFMPLMPRSGTSAAARDSTTVSMVLPLRQPVHRGAAGRLLGVRAWERSLEIHGRLARLLALSAHAPAGLTWLVDPAVLDAVASLAAGNPEVDLGPTAAAGSGSSPSSSPSSSPGSSSDSSPDSSSDSSSDASPSPSSSSQAGSGSPDASATAGSSPAATASGTGDGSTPASVSATGVAAAQRWLARFRRQVSTHTVAALPYGDLDAASVLRQPAGSGLRSLYSQAADLSEMTLGDVGVQDSTPVVAPASGYLPADALRHVPPGVTTVLSDLAYPRADQPVVASSGGRHVVLTDAEAGSGGPGPGPQYTALAVRQRVLSEAALHAMSADRSTPLLVSMPPSWNPGRDWSSADLFEGLDQSWLGLVSLSTAADGPLATTARSSPVYPRADRLRQVPRTNLVASRQLVRSGRTISRVLADNDSVDDVLARAAMLASSTSARRSPATARAQAVAARYYVQNRLSRVRVEGPTFVMMSGESGPVQVSVANDLDQPVRVGLSVTSSDPGLQFSRVSPLRIGAGRRASVRLRASADDLGVHPVTVSLTDVNGVPLGSRAEFSVRTSNVSTVIWVVMIAGGGLLLLAILIRLVRRIRRRQATHGPQLSDPSDRLHQELDA